MFSGCKERQNQPQPTSTYSHTATDRSHCSRKVRRLRTLSVPTTPQLATVVSPALQSTLIQPHPATPHDPGYARPFPRRHSRVNTEGMVVVVVSPSKCMHGLSLPFTGILRLASHRRQCCMHATEARLDSLQASQDLTEISVPLRALHYLLRVHGIREWRVMKRRQHEYL
ncbi:hypothetical protein E2C01_021356 [Portunus trituberculatus]|uniref:Uncharacterized protein n=1 Tax=Portunus trituberculatus TaxID=210409 RepID=A0A5B7E2E5_PORTR|nr:hypothetical protein [Portunus trituberculatus]